MSFPEFPKFYRDRFAQGPIGEVPPMDAEVAMAEKIREKGIAVFPHGSAAEALAELVRWHETQQRVDHESGDWWVAQNRLADVAGRFVETNVVVIEGRA